MIMTVAHIQEIGLREGLSVEFESEIIAVGIAVSVTVIGEGGPGFVVGEVGDGNVVAGGEVAVEGGVVEEDVGEEDEVVEEEAAAREEVVVEEEEEAPLGIDDDSDPVSEMHSPTQ